LAFFFRARVAGDETVAMANGLLYLLSAWLLYGLLKLVYDKPTALIAVIAYLFSLEAIGQALTADGATLGALVMLASLLCWAHMASKTKAHKAGAVSGITNAGLLASPWPWLVASSIFLGLMYLSGEFSLLTIGAIGWLLAASFATGRRKSAAILIPVVFVLVISPWLIRNYRALGTFGLPLKQYELLMHTKTFPGQSILWSMPDNLPNPVAFVLTHPKQILLKVVNALTGLYRAIPGLLSPYLWPFLLLGYFLVVQTDLQRRLWKFFGLAIILQAATLCFYDITNLGCLSVFIPLAYGLAAAAAVQFIRQYVPPARARVALIAGVAALLVFPYLTSTLLGGKVPASPSIHNLGLLANTVHPKDLIASDIAWDVAWYAERKALLLPRDAPEFRKLIEAGYKPAYVYLSRNLVGSRRYGLGRPVWLAMLTGRLNPAKVGLGLPLPMPKGELLIELPFAKYKVSDRLKEAFQKAKAKANEKGGSQ